MGYDICFRARLAGTSQMVSVGDDINHTSNTAEMVHEVCGSYPSDWDMMKCRALFPIVARGASKLARFPEKYRKYEPDNGWGSVESTQRFLSKIADNCSMYPTAIVEVDY